MNYPVYRFRAGGVWRYVAVAWAAPRSASVVERLLSITEPERLVVLNAALLAGPVHLATAVEYAVRAFVNCRNVARRLHVEVMLFAAATREISKALKLFEPRTDAGLLALAGIGSSAEEALEAIRRVAKLVEGLNLAPPAPSLIRIEEVIHAFRITEEELGATYAADRREAVEKNVLTRMAVEYLSR